MKREQQLSRQLNLMQLLEAELSNTVKFKVMNLINSCLTSSLALYHWRVVLRLDLENPRRRSLKPGCIPAKGNVLSTWSRFPFLQIFGSVVLYLHECLLCIYSSVLFCRFLLHAHHWIMMMCLSWTPRKRFISLMGQIQISKRELKRW